MSDKQQPKVRLVKCPKCAKLLPEPEHVPLYKCGGCNTILQAKNYRGFHKDTTLSSHEQNVTRSNGIVQDQDGGESSGSSRRSSSSGEHSLARDQRKDQDAVRYSGNSEQNGAANSSDHTSLSEDSIFLKNNGNGEIDTNLDPDEDQIEVRDRDAVESCCELEQYGAANSAHHTALSEESSFMKKKENGERDDKINLSGSKDIVSDGYSTAHKNKVLVQPTVEISAAEDDKVQIEQCVGAAVENHHQKQIQEINNDRETLMVEDTQVFKNEELQLCMAREPMKVKEHQHEQMQVGSVNSVRDASSPTESPAIENPAECNASDHEVSEEARTVHIVEQHFHQDIMGNEINHLDADKLEEIEKSGKKYDNGTNSNDLVECTVERFGSVKHPSAAPLSTDINQGGNDDSEDKLETYQRASVSAPSSAADLKYSDSSGNVKGTSKQNIKNFENSTVYINNEFGSLLKEVPISPTKRSPAYDGSVSSFEGNDDQVPERPVEVGEETMSTNNAVAGYDGPEEILEKNDISERMINRNPRIQTLGQRMTYRNPRGQTQAMSFSSLPLRQKSKGRMIVEEGSVEESRISRQNNRYKPNRDSILPRVPHRRRSSELAFETGSSSSYALHDEPSSHHMHHHHTHRRRFREAPLWREKEFLPAYYNYETSGEIYDRPMYHAYIDRKRQTASWSQSGTLPRMPYSGESLNGRHPYMHRYQDDRRWSAQLSRPAVCCHQGVYMGPSWETRWDPYDSYPTSPQYVESESSCAWGHDINSLSDDQRHKDRIMRRLYLREKRQTVKKHFHPIAGGAPFITCYFCFYVLQLPEGFLLSRKKRTHKLKCGACSSVLEFSLENEGGLAPCETNGERNANLAALSHVNHSRQSSLNAADGRELLSHDEWREKRKLVPENSMNGEKEEGSHNAADHSVRGRQAKVTWQLPARSKSPLHRLMGYSSPHELLSVREADDVER